MHRSPVAIFPTRVEMSTPCLAAGSLQVLLMAKRRLEKFKIELILVA